RAAEAGQPGRVAGGRVPQADRGGGGREGDRMTVASPSQGILFQRLRWRLVRNAGTQLFGSSRVRLVTMVLCSVVVCAAMFAAAYGGFDLLASPTLPPPPLPHP